MRDTSRLDVLRRSHTREAVRSRMQQPANRGYLSDSVLGGVDGCVTSFAVVAGSVGGALSAKVIVMLGLASLLADGFSMAASNYLSVKSEQEQVERVRREEEQHIAQVPEGEREELRQIFEAKGFQGEILERIVAVISHDHRLWVDTMLIEEHGLLLHGRHPLRAGLSTFVAFVLMGLMPLIPFFTLMGIEDSFVVSTVMTASAFLAVGTLKGYLLQRSMLASGLETVLIGSAAAALAYAVGYLIRQTLLA